MGKKPQKNVGATPKQPKNTTPLEIKEPEIEISDAPSPGDLKLQRQRERQEREAKEEEERKKKAAEKAKQDAKNSSSKKKNKKSRPQTGGSNLETIEQQFEKLTTQKQETVQNSSGDWKITEEQVPSAKNNTSYDEQKPRRSSIKLNRDFSYLEEEPQKNLTSGTMDTPTENLESATDWDTWPTENKIETNLDQNLEDTKQETDASWNSESTPNKSTGDNSWRGNRSPDQSFGRSSRGSSFKSPDYQIHDRYSGFAKKDSFSEPRRQSYGHSRFSGGRDDRSFQEFWRLKDKPTIKHGKLSEKKGDLFTAPEEYALAHCVAEDMAMGAGIARTFRTQFGEVGALLNQRQREGGLAVLQHKGRYIYYLVTKEISRGKPTYHTLWLSLNKLRDHMHQNNVSKLAIPQIGCGLDRLEWDIVAQMIEHVFRDADVDIVVYIWDESVEMNEPKKLLKKCAIVHKVMDLVDIERGTGLLYFGYVNGFETEEFKSLASKYSLLSRDYKLPRNVGDVVKTIDRAEYIYGLIINRTQNDEIDYLAVENAIKKLKKQIRADKTVYVGLQAFIDKKDKNLFYKLVALMQYIFVDVEIWVCWPKELEDKCPQGKAFY